MLGQTKFQSTIIKAPNKVVSKRIEGPKEFFGRNIYWFQIWDSIEIKSKMLLGPKISDLKKMTDLRPNEFQVQKEIGSETF